MLSGDDDRFRNDCKRYLLLPNPLSTRDQQLHDSRLSLDPDFTYV